MGNVKTKLSYPPLILPVCLVGANVNGKPNFEAIAWFNLVDYKPNLISVSSEKSHYTNQGVGKNKTFSVNIPSPAIVETTDYCGIHSGGKVDKSGVFDVFYGELKTAPMISDCPINIECKLIKTVELPHDELFIGEIIGVYSEEKYLTDGKPDIAKINPLLFEQGLPNYWTLGEKVARAFNIGKNYKPKAKC